MSDHPTLTMDLVRPVIDEIVKDNPEKVAGGLSMKCQYAAPDHEGPSCIVGALLYQLGWDYAELKQLDIATTDDDGTTVDALVDAGYLDADARTTQYLRWMQSKQDNGYTWLMAYRYAEELTSLQ